MGLFSKLATRSSRVTPGDEAQTGVSSSAAAAPPPAKRGLFGRRRTKGLGDPVNDENAPPANGAALSKKGKAARASSKKGKALAVAVTPAPSAAGEPSSAPELTLLLLGCDGAGKSSVFEALRGGSVGKGGPDPTNGFDTAKLQHSRQRLRVFDVGGGPKIRAIWQNYYADAHAAVFVVDASAPDRFAEAATLLHEAAAHARVSGKPLLILANKQDRPQACSGAELAEALRVHELDAAFGDACMVGAGCSLLADGATSGGGAGGAAAAPTKGVSSIAPASELGKAIGWLLGRVHAEYESLNARVAAEVAEGEAAAKAAKEARKARLAAKRAAREAAEAEEEKAKAAAAAAEGGGPPP